MVHELLMGMIDGGTDMQYFDRGDPSAFDWTVGDFTTDNTWYDLDCSSIVPDGASFIMFCMTIEDNAPAMHFVLREKGNSNNYNQGGVFTQVANQPLRCTVLVKCDANRVVQYRGANTVFTTINLLVVGWLI